ncbi:MAG: transglycosylase SLT domain-containing protein [Candidatus Eisenbacteria bacterium]|nr:transglycosylase SLT domain-containing protein [Candidatus Eisenbacteria bacterium]
MTASGHLHRGRTGRLFRFSLPLLALALVASLACGAAASWRAAADSLYGRAEDAYRRGSYGEAARLYDSVAARVGGINEAPGFYFYRLGLKARFMAGRSLELDGRHAGALERYEAALPLLPEVSDLIRIRMASCQSGLGRTGAAIDLLREVTDDETDGIFDLLAVEGIAKAYLEAGEHDLAVQWYRVLVSEAAGYHERARAGLELARAQRRRGDREGALRTYATVVEDFPRSPRAYDAMTEARTLSRAFTDRYSQGLVLYNRRRYREAQEFFAWYLRHDNRWEHLAEATYFLGRSYQRLGNYGAAASKYDEVVALGPGSEYYDLAWLKLAYCRRASGRDAEALATYDRYVALHPGSDDAPRALWEKARYLEEEQRWAEAVVDFRSLSELYPGSSLAADARFRAGLCLYKSGDLGGARAAFADLHAGEDGDDASRALFWSAKTLDALGKETESAELFRLAVRASKDSYYSRRAQAILGEETPGPARGSRVTSAEALEFATWLGRWYEEVYFPDARVVLRRRLLTDALFRRADLLLSLHMRDAAEREFERLEETFGNDPRMLDVLIAHYERSGLHKRGVRLAEHVLGISPADEIGDAPLHLRRRICPIHFRGLVQRECRRSAVPPDIFFSLIRQESLFEPEAVSWVGARGLSQIMPSTGRWLARRLGHRGYSTRLLLDPETNVRFGTYYLSGLIEDYEGDVLRALAAYNGGPESVERWWNYSGSGDTDVFVEDIGYPETADYVRRVYRYAAIYRELGVR